MKCYPTHIMIHLYTLFGSLIIWQVCGLYYEIPKSFFIIWTIKSSGSAESLRKLTVTSDLPVDRGNTVDCGVSSSGFNRELPALHFLLLSPLIPVPFLGSDSCVINSQLLCLNWILVYSHTLV